MVRLTARGATALAVVTAALALAACSSSSHPSSSSTGPAVKVTSVSVAPATAALALGASRSFTATASYSDGSVQDVTATAAWASSDAGVLRLGAAAAGGVPATALGLGPAQVTATVDGVRGSAEVTVTAAALQSLSVSPALASVAAGYAQQFTAIATYTDGSKADVTADATWSSSDATLASIARGLASGLAQGSVTIRAEYSGLAATAALSVTAGTLQSITVTPGDITLPLGIGAALAATGLFSDGSAQDLTAVVTWRSSDPTVATVAGGQVQPVGVGAATVTAALGALSGTATVQVTAATLVTIDVYPGAVTLAKGTSTGFTAVGTFSDGSAADVTASATWSVGPTGAVLLSSPGPDGVVATAAQVGAATVTAALEGVTGTSAVTVTAAALTSLAVAPATLSMPAGLSGQLTATGTFSDGSTQDLTAQVAWVTSDGTVASVSNAAGTEGLVTALGAGSATVTATLFGAAAGVDVTVSAAALRSVTVTPSPWRLPAGYQFRFTATGTYTDGSVYDVTDSATWTSSAPAVATVVATGTAGGTATGVTPGAATITAILDGVSGSSFLTVTNARLASIAVTPAPFTVAVGGTQALVATGTFSDGTTVDISRQCVWRSSSKAVAVVSRGGAVRGVQAGNVTITAKRTAKTGQAAGTVQ